MANTFQLEVATPERLLVRENCLRAQIPAENGYIGVLPEHAPLFAQLGIGALEYVTEGDRSFTLAVSQGFIEVRDNHVRVLADEAQLATEIDLSASEEAEKETRGQMGHPAPDTDFTALLVKYRKAEAWVAAAKQSAPGTAQTEPRR